MRIQAKTRALIWGGDVTNEIHLPSKEIRCVEQEGMNIIPCPCNCRSSFGTIHY